MYLQNQNFDRISSEVMHNKMMQYYLRIGMRNHNYSTDSIKQRSEIRKYDASLFTSVVNYVLLDSVIGTMEGRDVEIEYTP